MEFDEGENKDLIVDEGVIAVVEDGGDGHGVVVDDLEAFFDLQIRHNQPFFIQEDLAATATTILPTLHLPPEPSLHNTTSSTSSAPSTFSPTALASGGGGNGRQDEGR